MCRAFARFPVSNNGYDPVLYEYVTTSGRVTGDARNPPAARCAPADPGHDATGDVAFESRWHLAPTGMLVFASPTIGLVVFGRPEPPSGLVGFTFGSILFGLLSLYWSWVEAGRLAAATADRTPVWLVNLGGDLLVPPFAPASVYLLQRLRHVGPGPSAGASCSRAAWHRPPFRRTGSLWAPHAGCGCPGYRLLADG